MGLTLTTEPLDLCAAAQTHEAVRVTPRRDSSARYGMLVPQGWLRATRMGGVRFAPARAEPIGLFFEPQGQLGAAIMVMLARLPVEIALEDFVRGQSAAQGWTVKSVRWLDLDVGRRLDVLCVRTSGSRVDVRRTLAFCDHGRVLEHHAVARLEQWPQLESALWTSAASLQLASPSGQERMEAAEQHRVGPLLVDAPASWVGEAVVDVPSVSAVDLRLIVADRLRGYVRVEARPQDASESDVARLLARSDRELRTSGVVPARRKTPVEPIHGVPELPGGLGIFTAPASTPGDGETHTWYGYKVQRGRVYSVFAVCELLGKDRIGYLRTKRAFEIALQTAG